MPKKANVYNEKLRLIKSIMNSIKNIERKIVLLEVESLKKKSVKYILVTYKIKLKELNNKINQITRNMSFEEINKIEKKAS